MEISIQSPHFTTNDHLTDFVTKKVNSLSHLNSRIMKSEVCLKLDKSDTAENKVCEIKLVIPGNDLFAKRQCHTFEEAITKVVDALQEQVRKHKVY